MRLLTLRFLVLISADHVLGQACGPRPPPLAFPITDVQVDPAVPNSLMRGVAARIGTPAQNIIVFPWADLNNTYIYDEEAYCNPDVVWNPQICKVRRGGYFNETQSTSFTQFANIATAGGATQELKIRGSESGVLNLLSTSVAGTERISLGSGPDHDANSTTSLPIGIPRMAWDGGSTTLPPLGMGSNSTFLNALVRGGQIPSRVWSYFWGRTWAGPGIDMDGTLVLGGYDAEKVTGSNVTQRLDYSEETGCWTGMKVAVTDLVVNWRNGSDQSVMPANSAVPVCLVPQRRTLFGAPSTVVERFRAAVGMKGNSFALSKGMHWGARLYNSSVDVYDGDLTFVLSNGLSIRVPNHQFITPVIDIDRNGSLVINQTERELLISTADNSPAVLGRYFFSAAYLMVDHDAHTFTLWQANPSTKSTLAAVVSRPITDDGCESGGDDATTANTDTTGSEPSPDASSQPGAGTIAGAVVGAVGGVAVLAVLAFLLLRWRKKGRRLPADASSVGGPVEIAGDAKTLPLMASSMVPQEVPGNDFQTARELHAVSSASLHGRAWDNRTATTTGSPMYELDGSGTPYGELGAGNVARHH